jgi:hypothetical protein
MDYETAIDHADRIANDLYPVLDRIATALEAIAIALAYPHDRTISLPLLQLAVERIEDAHRGDEES